MIQYLKRLLGLGGGKLSMSLSSLVIQIPIFLIRIHKIDTGIDETVKKQTNWFLDLFLYPDPNQKLVRPTEGWDPSSTWESIL